MTDSFLLSFVVLGLSLPLLGVGCVDASRPLTQTVDVPFPVVGDLVGYDAPFSLAVGGTVSIAQEIRITLTKITDSRCPPDVYCIQAGERGVELAVTVENGGETETILLGEVSAKEQTVFLHTVHLASVNDTSATLLVDGTPLREQQEEYPE